MCLNISTIDSWIAWFYDIIINILFTDFYAIIFSHYANALILLTESDVINSLQSWN